MPTIDIDSKIAILDRLNGGAERPKQSLLMNT